jgi:hypothetical protein
VDDGELQRLKRAFFMQAQFEWNHRQHLGTTSISKGGMAIQTGAGVMLALKGKTLLPEVEETLLPLKRV